MIFNLYKQRGETPLECIQRFAKSKLGLKGEKMTYLGRLDPMAEGVLLMATGEDTNQKRREEFFGLDKEYDFISLFGFATDTYDVLGRIMRVESLRQAQDENAAGIFENEIRRVAAIYEGEREQEYPKYSSKRIASPEIIPENKKITIHKMQFHKLDTLNSKELFGRLLMDISKVKGDFRQNEILILWKEVLLGLGGSEPLSCGKREVGVSYLGHFSAHVSSGTYIRGIVNDMGNTLGCGATTLSIKRTRVGDYKIEDSLA